MIICDNLFFQSSSAHVWTSAFLLDIHRLCGIAIEPFSVTLAHYGLAECEQPWKNPLKYAAMARNLPQSTGME